MKPPLRPAAYLFRAATCHVRAHSLNTEPLRLVKGMYPDDQITPTILRSITVPAKVADASWAGPLAHEVVLSLLQSIVSVSAAADLLSRALGINFGNAATIRIPGRVTDPAGAGVWIGEGAIHVRNYITNQITMTPHKLAVITNYTREMVELSNLDAVVRSLISEAAALQLDMTLFSSTAEDAVNPGGILAGIPPIAAAASGSNRWDNMTDDITALIEALADRYAVLAPVFICSLGQAAAMKLRSGGNFDYPILASSALTAGSVIAVEPASLAATITDVSREFTTAEGTLLHEESTTPADIVAGGTLAHPVKSLFQIDAIGLKMVLKSVAWVMRAPHVAWVQGTNW